MRLTTKTVRISENPITAAWDSQEGRWRSKLEYEEDESRASSSIRLLEDLYSLLILEPRALNSSESVDWRPVCSHLSSSPSHPSVYIGDDEDEQSNSSLWRDYFAGLQNAAYNFSIIFVQARALICTHEKSFKLEFNGSVVTETAFEIPCKNKFQLDSANP